MAYVASAEPRRSPPMSLREAFTTFGQHRPCLTIRYWGRQSMAWSDHRARSRIAFHVTLGSLEERSDMIIDSATLDPASAYKLLIGSITPRAIGWISTLSKDGVANLAPI